MDPIDELVSRLPLRPRATPTRRSRPTIQLPTPRPARPARPTPPQSPVSPSSGRRGGWRIPWWLVIILLIATIVIMSKRPDPSSSAPQSAKPAPTVTVVETVQVGTLPESCRRALELMPSVMDDIAQLNGKSQVQIDITGAAHQAIFAKDWTRLSRIESDQQRLYQQHQDAYQDFKKKYQPLKDALAQCKKEAG